MNAWLHRIIEDRRRLETAVVASACLAAVLALVVVAVQVERQQSPAGYGERHVDANPGVPSLPQTRYLTPHQVSG